MKRPITILILFLLAAAGIYAYRLYTGKVQDLKNAEAEAIVTATDLTATFERDSAIGNRHYLGKIIAVAGTIKTIEQEHGTITLGSEAGKSSVRCSMDTNAVKAISAFKISDTVLIKGVCIGYNADELGLGADVVLNRCVIEAEK